MNLGDRIYLIAFTVLLFLLLMLTYNDIQSVKSIQIAILNTIEDKQSDVLKQLKENETAIYHTWTIDADDIYNKEMR